MFSVVDPFDAGTLALGFEQAFEVRAIEKRAAMQKIVQRSHDFLVGPSEAIASSPAGGAGI
jgi:hypothetical protein